MHRAKKIHIRHRKSRVKLKSLSQSQRTTPKNNNLTPRPKQAFSALQHLWNERYITFEDYATACYYIEFTRLIRTLSGAPSGYHRQVSWQRPNDISRISWIQADMASLDQQRFPRLSDEALLLQWKHLQCDLSKHGYLLKDYFHNLMFQDTPPSFAHQTRLYLAAFIRLIPIIRAFFQDLYAV